MINARELISEDGKALVMLCSQLGINGGGDASVLTPLTLSEWNAFARRIHDSALKRPSALLGLTAKDLAKQLILAKPEAERVIQLLARGGSLALELERLAARGIWCVTRADDAYPARLRNTLKHQAPAVLFGAGELAVFHKARVAIIGSRNLDERGQSLAQALGGMCARISAVVVSGGARGTDRIAMQAALEAGGSAVGALADSLEKTVRQPDVREFITDGRLTLLTPYQPDSGFSVGAAMGRNKIIYGLADYAVVVASDYEKGGTWAGAVEALKAEWCPVFVSSGADAGAGNKELVKKGALPLSEAELDGIVHLTDWMKERVTPKLNQPELLPASIHEGAAPYTAQARKAAHRSKS
jgi:predicted Rossmann fold nucleotide-binding protein DprA/Smf involved in DNA uptake